MNVQKGEGKMRYVLIAAAMLASSGTAKADQYCQRFGSLVHCYGSNGSQSYGQWNGNLYHQWNSGPQPGYGNAPRMQQYQNPQGPNNDDDE